MTQTLGVKEQIKQINILYIALLAGQILIAIVFVYINTGTGPVEETAAMTVDSSLTLIAAMISVTAIALSYFIYNKRKAEGARLTGNLEAKMEHFRASFVLRAALIEGANLVALMFYFLEGNFFYLILFAIGIVIFLLIRPSVPKIAEDYQLSGAEQSELQTALN